MFSLALEFLTGNAVLTSAASRERAEWPPHPARIFMALVAAHFEMRPIEGDDDAARRAWATERSSLKWLEQQGVPALRFGEATPRSVVKVYVPVNDASLPVRVGNVKAATLRGALGVMPEFRSRQERTFPAMHVGLDRADRFVFFIWCDAKPTDEIRRALEGLAGKVVRVGHSSSLVRVWVPADKEIPEPEWHPGSKENSAEGKMLRIFTSGFLRELEQRFNEADIEAFFELSEQISTTSGRGRAKAKEDYAKRFGEEWRTSAAPPVRKRPGVGLAAHYVKRESVVRQWAQTIFDRELLVLTKQDGPVLGLESTRLLVEALRGALLTGADNAPEWFTGHKPDGSKATVPHIALAPLAYVSDGYADGHIMGLALALPTSVEAAERARVLSSLLYNEDGTERTIELRLGRLGLWTLRREDRITPPIALQSETWTKRSRVWATMTPFVLDRHPKHDRSSGDAEERQAWRQEVAAGVVESCRRIGLPSPTFVDLDKTSWHRGAPRSMPGPDGYPWFNAEERVAPRQQLHVYLQFNVPVEGPVLLGSGRYRGYGFCKPLLGEAP